jgi:hypothetical protein
MVRVTLLGYKCWQVLKVTVKRLSSGYGQVSEEKKRKVEGFVPKTTTRITNRKPNGKILILSFFSVLFVYFI